jgi:two-component system, sensor histidine kinase PdtaS
MLDPRMHETEFRDLADNAPMMMWRARAAKLCDWFNKPWLAFTGRRLEEEIGNGWADGVHPEDIATCLAAYGEAFDRRETFTIEYRLRRHDGVYRSILDKGSPFFRDGTFVAYFGSCIDVTPYRETEDRLRALVSEREELLREVHHRVNNNLQTLTALLRLRGRTTDDSGRRLLQEVSQRVAAMAAVQRYLHNLDGLTDVSARQLLRAILHDILPRDPELGPIDFSVSLAEAANLGLAVAEIAGLCADSEVWGADEGQKDRFTVRLDPSSRGVTIRGRGVKLEGSFALQLVRAYASAAGGHVEIMKEEEDPAVAIRLTSR